MPDDFKVELSMPGSWANVELMRYAVSCYARALFADEMFTDAITMVSAELLENAVKYGDSDDGRPPRIRYTMVGDDTGVVVSVANPAGASGSTVKSLIASIRWIREIGDPSAAYVKRMRDVFEGKVSAGGMGLVRIAYEGGCELDWGVSDQGNVEVRAIFAPPGGARLSSTVSTTAPLH